MKADELELWLNTFLDIKKFIKADNALNGMQVGRSCKDIVRVAVAVDANLETIERAIIQKADAIIVHHGLFWNKKESITKVMYERVKRLIDADINLYAYHLPLDSHPECGNNAVMAQILELDNITNFGSYHNLDIGYKGKFKSEKSLEDIVSLLLPDGSKPQFMYPFGKKNNSTCGIISGGAAPEALQAIEENLDVYITGDASHEVYSSMLESHTNMISLGHYKSEIWGVQSLMEKIAFEKGLHTFFIDLPTGL